MKKCKNTKKQVASHNGQATTNTGSVGQTVKNAAKTAGKTAAKTAAKTAGKMVMSFVRAIGLKVLIFAMILIFIVACAWAVISGIFSILSGVVDGLGNAFASVSADDNLEDGINITDEQIEQLISAIESNGLTVEDLYLCGDIDYSKEADDPENIAQRNKYLRQFLLAELCTQYPYFGIQEDETHYNGIIYVKRAMQDSTDITNAVDMTYIRRDTFENIVLAINSNTKDGVDLGEYQNYSIEQLQSQILNLYSIDNDGNLYFATSTRVETEGSTPQVTISAKSINYKKTVEKYSLPIEVSLSLCFVTQNPEYVYQFIEDHVLSGRIEITILDTQRVDTHESWYDWTVEESKSEEQRLSQTELKEGIEPESSSSTNTINYERQQYSKIVTTTTTSSAQITLVDTWMAKTEATFTNTQGNVEYPLGQETVVKDVECPANIVEHESYVEDRGDSSFNVVVYRNVTSSTFTDKESIVYNEWQRGTVTVDTDAMEEKASSILNQWNQRFSIPNDPNRVESAGPAILTAEEMFLELLNHEDTQKQLEIYKYLINKYKNDDYSIENLDISIYQDIELEVIQDVEDIIVETTRSLSELVLNQDEIQTAIEACFDGEQKDNLLDNISVFYEIQRDSKVNAIFAIAVAVQESNAGTNWALIDESTNNWYSIQGTGSMFDYQDENGTYWKTYSTPGAAIRDFARLISTSSYYFGGGNYTVRTIANSYCVPPEGWANGVIAIMKRMYNALGIDTSMDNSLTDRPIHGSPVPGTGGSGSIGADSGAGYWGTYTTSVGKTYKLYYQNYISSSNNWGIDSNQMCVATAYAIMHSASGGGDPTSFWNGNYAINGGLTRISRDTNQIISYLNSGNPVAVYSNYGSAFYGSPHALVLLEANANGEVFVVNPYYVSNGAGGQKAGGWYPLSTILSYPAASTNSFGSCGVLLN